MIGSDRGGETLSFYADALRVLAEAEVPHLLGGAFAFERYTGIARDTKDIDVFVRPADARATLDTLAAARYRAELTFPHWLGKAFHDGESIDVIFSSGNGIATVDDGWFAHAIDGEVLGRQVRLCPPEEMIWSKAFVQERERYDGADIAHILRAQAERLDWPRLLARFGPMWRVLYAHLVLFGFSYPGERHRLPAAVVRELTGRLETELDAPDGGKDVCRATLLSREQYLVDVNEWGYRDARLDPPASLSPEEIARWTEAIGWP